MLWQNNLFITLSKLAILKDAPATNRQQNNYERVTEYHKHHRIRIIKSGGEGRSMRVPVLSTVTQEAMSSRCACMHAAMLLTGAA